MIEKLLQYAFGYKMLSSKREDSAAIMNLCMRYGYVYRDARFEGEQFIFKAPLLRARKIRERCAERGIDIREVGDRGGPAVVSRYRHRYGVGIGVLVFAAIVFFSGRVVWDIRVDGNRRLSDSEVKEQLALCGLHVGDRISSLNADSIENRVIVYSDDISWISVNLIGTVAQVEIRESEVVEEREEHTASNIVAAMDGQIELFEDVRGNILLDIGTQVRKGDLIVSGIYGSEEEGLRYTAARGRVLARTERDLEVEIPLIYDKKVYTGRVFTEKYLVFFEKEIKIYRNSRNLCDSCDTIDTVEYLDILSAGELPVGIRTVKHLEYTYESTQRSAEEARELAEYKLERLISELSKSSELISKSTLHQSAETAYKIKCRVRLIEDIALIKEIEIDGMP